MRILLYGHPDVEYGKKYFHKEEDSSFFAISHASGYLPCGAMTRLRASFTIEAACVMAIVFTAIATVILGAYRLHDKTAGAMALQEAVERERRREDGWGAEWEDDIKVVFLKERYLMKTETKGTTATGTAQGNGWSLEIEKKQYEPEGFLRLTSLAEDGILGREGSDKTRR